MTADTQKLIEEIKEYYGVSDLSELNEAQWIEISGGSQNWQYRLNEEFIEKYSHVLSWWRISGYQKLSEEFIEKHEGKVDWEFISRCQKLSPEFAERFADRLNWIFISEKQELTPEFVDRHKDRLDWEAVSWKQKLSEKFMDMYAGKLNWKLISGYQELSEEFIKKHQDKVDWNEISLKQKLSEPFMEKYEDELDWNWISREQDISLEFIKKHSNKINYMNLFYNEHLNFPEKIKKLKEYPEWTDVILKIYKDNIYDTLSVSDIKRKFQTRKFWKSYIEYLKNEYPDKNVFQVKLLDTVTDISEIFNIDKNKLLDIISKSINNIKRIYLDNDKGLI